MDPYQSPDTQTPEVIAAMAQRLEDRGDNEVFNGYIDQYLAEIDASGISSLLDVGCGTGVVTRRLASQLPGQVAITGVDISDKLLDVAREKSDPRIRWVQVDAATLPFDDGSIDVVVLHTILSHVPDPVAVIKEAARVMKPDGRMIIFDADYASTTFANEDLERGKAIDLALFSAVIHNLDVCRLMPRHIHGAGLKLSGHQSHVLAEAGEGDFWLSSVEGFAKLIPALEIMPAAEGEAWAESMRESHANGTFFATGNYYTFFAAKT